MARPCALSWRDIRVCVPSLDEFSFPSGHTLHSVACSVVLTAYYPMLGWVASPFTLLVASSRIVLGLHYPSDVLDSGLLRAARRFRASIFCRPRVCAAPYRLAEIIAIASPYAIHRTE